MSVAAESKITHEPKNEKDEHYFIASLIVKEAKRTDTYKKKNKTDELHAKVDMTITCIWHDPNSGKWTDSEIKHSANYNITRGDTPPKAGEPLTFERTKTGGFKL